MNSILETIIMVVVALGLVGVGMVFVPFAQKKGWIKDSNIKTTEQMLLLFKAIMNKNLTDGKLKNKTLLIYDSIVNALKFVQNVSWITDVQEKKELIYYRTISELEKYGISIDEDDKLIIQILIDNSVDLVVKD